jgi:hypothetical protein
MIKLTTKTQQDFLNREWVQKLLDAGVNMDDAKYFITNNGGDYIIGSEEVKDCGPIWKKEHQIVPTYTVSEILYKLHEWVYPTINGHDYSGGLRFFKDAPFYVFYYDLYYAEDKKNPGIPVGVKAQNDEYLSAELEYPIESLAALLIQCHKKDIGIKNKEGKQISDTGDISDK